MHFIDEVTVHVRGGSGGSGLLHWKRAKFVPRGGPDGGDGGNGGAVIFEAVNNLNTLVDLAYSPHLFAEDGSPGGENLKTGKDGNNLHVRIPAGTQVFFNDKMVADLGKSGSRWIAARGGKGGKGNAYFKSSTNQAPEYAQSGISGEERTYRLVLKSVADIGLVGLPNAGKSTLVRSMSSAKPKVADYPFTTLSPELGVVMLSDNRRFVLADIPGIIEGASNGKGLGLTFLKHIERTKVLVFVIDITQCPSYQNALDALEAGGQSESNIAKLAFETIGQLTLLKNELRSYSETLLEYPHIVLITKNDAPFVEEVMGVIKSKHPEDQLIQEMTSCSSHMKSRLGDVAEMMWKNLCLSINS
ncbi:MAG TPA: GTPase ObgE [Oligoflexia bacterium]|nr:GTPase ObgE [Oligoflexia bacterium]